MFDYDLIPITINLILYLNKVLSKTSLKLCETSQKLKL